MYLELSFFIVMILFIIIFLIDYQEKKENKNRDQNIRDSLLLELTRNDTYKLYLDYCSLIKEVPEDMMSQMIKERITTEMLIELQELILKAIDGFTDNLKNLN